MVKEKEVRAWCLAHMLQCNGYITTTKPSGTVQILMLHVFKPTGTYIQVHSVQHV